MKKLNDTKFIGLLLLATVAATAIIILCSCKAAQCKESGPKLRPLFPEYSHEIVIPLPCPPHPYPIPSPFPQ